MNDWNKMAEAFAQQYSYNVGEEKLPRCLIILMRKTK